MEIGPDGVGKMVTTFVLLWNHPAVVFSPKTVVFRFVDIVVFQKVCVCRKPLKMNMFLVLPKRRWVQDMLCGATCTDWICGIQVGWY